MNPLLQVETTSIMRRGRSKTAKTIKFNLSDENEIEAVAEEEEAEVEKPKRATRAKKTVC